MPITEATAVREGADAPLPVLSRCAPCGRGRLVLDENHCSCCQWRGGVAIPCCFLRGVCRGSFCLAVRSWTEQTKDRIRHGALARRLPRRPGYLLGTATRRHPHRRRRRQWVGVWLVRALGPRCTSRCRPQRLDGPLLHLVGKIDGPVRLGPGGLNSDAPRAAKARLVDEPTYHVLVVVPGVVGQFRERAHRSPSDPAGAEPWRPGTPSSARGLAAGSQVWTLARAVPTCTHSRRRSRGESKAETGAIRGSASGVNVCPSCSQQRQSGGGCVSHGHRQ